MHRITRSGFPISHFGSPHRLSFWLTAIVLIVLIAACDATQPSPTATPSFAPTASPSQTPATPTSTALPPSPAPPTPTATPTPSPSPTPTPAPAPTPTTAAPTPLIPDAPKGDPLELALRLRYKGAATIQPLPFRATDFAAGREEKFSLLDLSARRAYTITATLRYVSPSAYFYLENGQSVSQEEFQRSARELEERIVPAVRRLANPKWQPGAGLDSRMTILHARISGVAGYFSFADLLPRTVNRFSNERPMTYISLGAVRPGTIAYYGTLTHEFQHAAQTQADPYEDTWLQEGASEYVAQDGGYPANFLPYYFGQTDTPLTQWPDVAGSTLPSYGAAHSFVRYLSRRFGAQAVVELLTSPLRGAAGLEAWLRAWGVPGGFEAVAADWAVASYLESRPSPRPSQTPSVSLGPPSSIIMAGNMERPGPLSGEVRQYATDYISVRAQQQPARITFQGPTQVSLLPTTAPSGKHFWWSNRGDAIDSTLTRRFDLTGLQRATLIFRLWYDLEENFDYAYVEASRDGKTWDILQGRHSTTDNPVDQSFGPAYTGRSGSTRSAEWVTESIDLSAYAGGPVWVRFELVTDQAVHNPGLALDDIAIPEARFADDAESPGTWEAQGFLRTDNVLPQQFAVQFIPGGEGPAIQRMALDSNNSGQIALPAGTGGVLVINAFAPATSAPAPYILGLQLLP